MICVQNMIHNSSMQNLFQDLSSSNKIRISKIICVQRYDSRIIVTKLWKDPFFYQDDEQKILKANILCLKYTELLSAQYYHTFSEQ